MLNLNSARLESELLCFVKKGVTPKDSIIVVVHVDDLLSVGKREKLDRFFAQLAETLKIKHIEYIENGKPVLFLGDYITKCKDKITLKSKDTYVDGYVLLWPHLLWPRPTLATTYFSHDLLWPVTWPPGGPTPFCMVKC